MKRKVLAITLLSTLLVLACTKLAPQPHQTSTKPALITEATKAAAGIQMDACPLVRGGGCTLVPYTGPKPTHFLPLFQRGNASWFIGAVGEKVYLFVIVENKHDNHFYF